MSVAGQAPPPHPDIQYRSELMEQPLEKTQVCMVRIQGIVFPQNKLLYWIFFFCCLFSKWKVIPLSWSSNYSLSDGKNSSGFCHALKKGRGHLDTDIESMDNIILSDIKWDTFGSSQTSLGWVYACKRVTWEHTLCAHLLAWDQWLPQELQPRSSATREHHVCLPTSQNTSLPPPA